MTKQGKKYQQPIPHTCPLWSQEVQHISERMQEDGYAMLRGHEEQWPVALQQVREGIESLRAAGWPPSFIMMFDEAWLIMHAVSDLMAKGVPAPARSGSAEAASAAAPQSHSVSENGVTAGERVQRQAMHPTWTC